MQELRNNNISAELYPSADTKLDKQLKYADKTGIPFVVILGADELSTGVVKVKKFPDGEQVDVKITELISHFESVFSKR